MKTKQEQIEKMAQAMCGYCLVDKRCVLKYSAPCSEAASQDCSYKESAEELICKGYGDISEYKAEIERLKKEASDIRKGTAKEILQTLYDKCYEINDETGESMGNFVSDDDILCLAKHYGVEVDV